MPSLCELEAVSVWFHVRLHGAMVVVKHYFLR